MPIPVICPHCHARFQVSEKFAGKTGPCPKCKGQIKVPEKSEEVVIHAPENFGPKGTEGVAVLKPIERKEATFSPIAAVVVGAVILCSLMVAFVVGRSLERTEAGVKQEPVIFLAIGAILLGPLAAWSGYGFLRNDELEPYRGTNLIVRSLICGAVYAVLWGIYALLWWYLELRPPGGDILTITFVLGGMMLLGSAAAFATLDLDATSAAMHCGMYLLVTITLRLVMGLGPL